MNFRFSLKALMVFVTVLVCSVFLAKYWWNSRLEVLLDQYLALNESNEYDKAAVIAERASRLYPESDIAEYIEKQSEYILHELRNAEGDNTEPVPKEVCKACGRRCHYPLDWVPTIFN